MSFSLCLRRRIAISPARTRRPDTAATTGTTILKLLANDVEGLSEELETVIRDWTDEVLVLVDVDIGITMYVVTSVGVEISVDAFADIVTSVGRLFVDSTEDVTNGVVVSNIIGPMALDMSCVDINVDVVSWICGGDGVTTTEATDVVTNSVSCGVLLWLILYPILFDWEDCSMEAWVDELHQIV